MIEIVDIECVLCHVIGGQNENKKLIPFIIRHGGLVRGVLYRKGDEASKNWPYKSAI